MVVYLGIKRERPTLEFLGLVFMVVFMVVFAWAGPGRAEAPEALEQAKSLFKQAETHYYVGEFEVAVKLYSEAYKAQPLPGFLFNIAQCHRHLGQFKQAILFYKLYLAKMAKMTDAHRSEVAGFITECEQGQAKQRVKVGPATQPYIASVPHKTDRVPLDQQAQQPAIRQTSQARRRSAIWLWTGMGVTAAFLTVGTVTGVLANDQNQEYRDPSTSNAQAQSLKDTGQPLGIASAVTLGLGGAVAVATALHYWFNYRTVSERHSTMAARPIPGGAVLFIGGGF